MLTPLPPNGTRNRYNVEITTHKGHRYAEYAYPMGKNTARDICIDKALSGEYADVNVIAFDSRGRKVIIK
jgi:hypothetical protein